MYLFAVLDDYSRYIIAWKLCSTMREQGVAETLDMALAAPGCDQAHVRHRPRLLSDTGSCYISQELADHIHAKDMDHVREAPFHPRTQEKIERWQDTQETYPVRKLLPAQ